MMTASSIVGRFLWLRVAAERFRAVKVAGQRQTTEYHCCSNPLSSTLELRKRTRFSPVITPRHHIQDLCWSCGISPGGRRHRLEPHFGS